MNGIRSMEIARGEDILSRIGAFALEQGWKDVFVVGAVGSMQDMTFTAPQTREFPPVVGQTFCQGPGEVLSFSGEIVLKEKADPILLRACPKDDGSPLFVHVHASVAIAGGHVYGGGLRGGTPYRSLRVFLQPMAEDSELTSFEGNPPLQA